MKTSLNRNLLIIVSVLVNTYGTLQLFVTPAHIFLQLEFLGWLLNCGFFGMTFAITKSLKNPNKLSKLVFIWSCLGLVFSLCNSVAAGKASIWALTSRARFVYFNFHLVLVSAAIAFVSGAPMYSNSSTVPRT